MESSGRANFAATPLPPLHLEILSRLLMAGAFSTLAYSNPIHPFLLAAGFVAIAASFFPLFMSSWGQPRPRFWNAVTLTVIVLFLPDLLWWAESSLDAAIHLLIYLMIYRLFHLTNPRAHLQLLLVGFLEVLAASQLSDGLFLGISFFAFLVGSVWVLILIHLTAEAQKTPYPHSRLISPGFFAMVNVLILCSFLFTLIFFFAVPRVTSGLFSKEQPEPVRVAGFSEEVSFGSIGPIKAGSEPVMRVLVAGQEMLPGPRLYLRGMAFGDYDGVVWSNHRAVRKKISPEAGGLYRIEDPGKRSPQKRGPLVQQRILLEPLETTVLFGFSHPVWVKGDSLSVAADQQESIHLNHIPVSRIQYSVASRLHRVTPHELQQSSFAYPEPVSQQYLNLPEINPRIAELARSVAAESLTLHEKIKAIEAHLMFGYEYSLEVSPDPDLTPMDDFFFGQRKGYCEHFATAMVLMLRTLGIPSRLVTGFLPDEWNEFGGYYIVRQRDAHAWVEVYFPSAGWVTFDPTPPELSRPSLWGAGLAHAFDHWRTRWDRYIINYSGNDQAEVIASLKRRAVRASDTLQSAWAAVKNGLGEVLPRLTPPWLFSGAILGLLIAALILFRHWNPLGKAGFRRHLSRSSRSDPATQFYVLMLGILESKGLAKADHLTPSEFLRTLQIAGRDRERVREITQIYQQCRFGGMTLGLAQRRKVELLLQDLIKAPFEGPGPNPDGRPSPSDRISRN